MTARKPRTTVNPWTRLALGLAACLLAACGTQASADTPSPPTPTASPTAEARATMSPTTPPTATAEPATATEVPPSATPRPTRTRAASATPTATEAAATATRTAAAVPATPAGTGDFTPAQASIWNTALVGGDNMTGSCSTTANAPYGPMQLTPGDGTLAMHNTVPEDYVLSRTAPNTYQYSGPAAVIEGTLTLDLRFTSATTLQMTRTFVSSAEPGCTHVHNYTGTFSR